MTKTSSRFLPRLENGDRMTRSEFEKRYEAMPDIKKAELIEGVVFVSSPVRIANHGRPHAQIIAWLGVYYAATPGVDLADNTTVRLDSNLICLIAMTSTTSEKLYSFAEYLAYDDGTDNRYELVDGKLELMNPPTFRHLLIAKLIEQKLDAEISRLNLPWLCFREAGVRTGWRKSRLTDIYILTFA